MTAVPIQVHLVPDHLRLTLGERTSIEVEVFNASPVVEEFRVDFVGPAADPVRPEWVTATPQTVALFPNTSGVVVLTLEVPAASQLLAGRQVAGIAVRSTTDPRTGYVAELPITIDAQPFVSLHLNPEMADGGRTAYTEAVIRNLGNVAVTVRLHATDPTGKLRFHMERPEALLPTDEELRIPIELEAGRPLIGHGRTRPYLLAAEVEDRAMDVGAESRPAIDTVRTEGSFSQSPWLSGRILTVIGTLLPVVAILVAAWILRPQPDPVDLTGQMAFGVQGLVDTVPAREGEVVLAGAVLARLNPDEAAQAFVEKRLALRRAILDLEGLSTERLVNDAQAVLDDSAPPFEPDESGDFLAALVADLEAAVSDSMEVRTSALISYTDAFTLFCSTVTGGSVAEEETDEDGDPVEEPVEQPVNGAWPECAQPQAPLPAEVSERVAALSAENPAARAVLDAESHFSVITSNATAMQSLYEQVSARADELAAGAAEPPVPPTPEEEQLTAALAVQREQDEFDYQLSRMEQGAAIAEAQLECRDARDDVGRTVLRAPVDVLVRTIHAAPGAHVDADTAIITLERTDGREFVTTALQRSPAPQDIPADVTCPGTLDELLDELRDSGVEPADNGEDDDADDTEDEDDDGAGSAA